MLSPSCFCPASFSLSLEGPLPLLQDAQEAQCFQELLASADIQFLNCDLKTRPAFV